MENNGKSIGQQMREGYDRGVKMAGGREDASQARSITSPEPLPDELHKIKKFYWIFLVACIGGIIIPALLAIGIFGLLITCCIDDTYTRHKRSQLRIKKFKLAPGVDNDTLFRAIQPVLISKYGMQVEKRNDGVVMITHDKIIYDILIEEDNTFCIWWRMTWGRAFLVPERKYSGYRKSLAAMGIIAYEIQKALPVNGEVVQGMEG